MQVKRIAEGEHSGILLTFIKLPFSIKNFVLSIFEWLLKTGFTVEPVLSGHSQKDQKLVLMTDYRLIQSKELQNAPRRAFCNTFGLH